MVQSALEALSHAFVLRALAVGGLVSLCAALLGTVLVLKHYALIGHGLADVGFASLTVGLVLGMPPLLFAGPVVTVASFLMMFASQRYGSSGDVAIGVASTGSLALGIVVASTGPGFNLNVQNYLFGSVLSVTGSDVWLAAALAATVVGLFAVFYNRLFLITFDESFARACGVNVSFYHFLVSFLTALTVVVGMRMVGTLLISGLVIFPVITARRLTSSFRGMTLAAAALSIAGFAAGMLLSLVSNWPAGASVVAIDIAAFALTFLLPLRRRG